MQAALQAHVKQHETLVVLPCSPTVRPNHTIGEEATQVTVVVSETCQGYIYSQTFFSAQVSAKLSQRAEKVIGTLYRRIGNVLIRQQATNITKTDVTIHFTSQALFAYSLSSQAQSHIKQIIAGKRKQEALRILRLQPGINQAIITGIDDLAKLPRDPATLHLILVQ